MNLNPHPKIYTLGTRYTKDLFVGEVQIQEKIDGSQFTFMKHNGKLHFRSKGVVLYDAEQNKQFAPIINYLVDNATKIPDNYLFHGEYLAKPRHNTLAYDRIPRNYLTIFAMKGIRSDSYIEDYERMAWCADRMGFDVVPLLFRGEVIEPNIFLTELLEIESYLGGCKVEGVVIKNYAHSYQFSNMTIPFLCGKYVRDDFKEKNQVAHKKLSNQGKLEDLKQELRSEVRWGKAVQALRDNGQLVDEPKDIGPLMKYINQDIEVEEKEYIKDKLYNIYKKELLRSATYGFPEWYKEKLLDSIRTG
jgi:hypothetical protein